jgi:hypothetical protein
MRLDISLVLEQFSTGRASEGPLVMRRTGTSRLVTSEGPGSVHDSGAPRTSELILIHLGMAFLVSHQGLLVRKLPGTAWVRTGESFPLMSHLMIQKLMPQGEVFPTMTMMFGLMLMDFLDVPLEE